jgi:hypothetical protein
MMGSFSLMMIGCQKLKEVNDVVTETKEALETWQYLRSAYYPRFVEGVTSLPWDERYDVLKEIYGDWEERGVDPVESMMEYIFEKTYFAIFCRGVEVMEDGSFKINRLISNNLGKVGIFDESY